MVTLSRTIVITSFAKAKTIFVGNGNQLKSNSQQQTHLRRLEKNTLFVRMGEEGRYKKNLLLFSKLSILCEDSRENSLIVFFYTYASRETKKDSRSQGRESSKCIRLITYTTCCFYFFSTIISYSLYIIIFQLVLSYIHTFDFVQRTLTCELLGGVNVKDFRSVIYVLRCVVLV